MCAAGAGVHIFVEQYGLTGGGGWCVCVGVRYLFQLISSGGGFTHDFKPAGKEVTKRVQPEELPKMDPRL